MSALNSAVQEVQRLEVQLDASQRRQQATQERLDTIQQELEVTERQLQFDEQQVMDDRLKLEAARAQLHDEEQLSTIAPSATVTVVADGTAPTDGTSTIGMSEVESFFQRIFRDNDYDEVTLIVTLPDGEKVPVDFKRDAAEVQEGPINQDI